MVAVVQEDAGLASNVNAYGSGSGSGKLDSK
jgi:hypothetical protein